MPACLLVATGTLPIVSPLMQQKKPGYLTNLRQCLKTKMDLFGVTVLIASSADVSAESVLSGGDMSAAFADAPGVLLMTVPQEMAAEGGEFGFSAAEVQELADSGQDVEITRQGDVTIDGVKGYEFVGKGEIEELGSGRMGVHFGVLERESGPLAFIGFSPEQDMDKNLDIFEYMFESIKFK